MKDGVIEDPKRCTYDPKPLIGTSAGDCGAFTDADANVIRKLWEGPRREDGSFLWYGLPRGADLNALWTSRGTPLRPQPFGISMDWFRYFLTQDPKFDGNTVTPAAYERLWDQSVEQYGIVFGTDNPDLTAFRDRGGKAIVWHGWADQLISAEGTVDYYTRVQQQMGGAKKTSEFIRLFMAPGVGHCARRRGPTPTGQFEALLAWVEDGKAPETLLATRRDQTGRHTVAAAVRVSARREVQGQRAARTTLPISRAAPASEASCVPDQDTGGDCRRRPRRTAARPSPAPQWHRLGHRREPQPRLRHRSRQGRRPGAGHRGPAERDGRRRRAVRAGLRHEGLYVSFQGQRHRIDLAELTGGKAITVYGQNEVVRDLIDARTGDDASAVLRGRARLGRRARLVAPGAPLPAWRRRSRGAVRLHRRLRRLSRHLPSVDSRPAC